MSNSNATPLLEVRNIEAGYGASQVLFGVSLSIAPHQVVSLMGRNGMGKSTTIKCITGALPVRKGQIFFEGQEITNLPADEIARRGIALVPEGRMCFPNLTVKEHLVAFARKPDRSQETAWDLQRIYDLFPRLKEREHHMGSQLSGGEQQMLAIGRALSTNPKLLILDEATEGLAPVVREEIWTCLEKLKTSGQAILIIDKYIDKIKKISEEIIFLERGKNRISKNFEVEMSNEIDNNLKNIISVWEKTIDLQMHFNEICMNIRKTAVGTLGVLLAAGAIAFRFGGKVSVFGNEVSIAFLFTVISIFVWMAFYLMDRFWYHELLRSSVKYSESLEEPAKKSGLSIPLNMSSKIREANHNALKMSGAAKINLFYLLVVFVLVLSSVFLFTGAVQPILKINS